MPKTEHYIGPPAYSEEASAWSISLDEDLKENFESICALAETIFDARACMLYANFPQAAIQLTSVGEASVFSDEEIKQLRSTDEVSETLLESMPTEGALNHYRIVSPIMMPTGLKFGWLVIFKRGVQALTERQYAVLHLLNRDITNHLTQKKQEFQAAVGDGLQNLITEHNDDLILVKDEQFRIVFANNAFLRVYPEEMQDRIIGFTTVEEYDEKEANAFLAQDKIAFESGYSKVVEELHMPGGQFIILETVKRRIEDAKGKPYILVIGRDITQREESIRELKAANDELETFTSIASHDLKSPLNAIRRLLEWIQEDCAPLLPPEHLENMQLVVGRADRMEALLNDLLTYARIGKGESVAAAVNLAQLYDDIAELLEVPEGFTVNVPDYTVYVAEVPFKTVILNLVSNAIKHNDKAEGVIDIRCTESMHFYTVEVADNGPGSDPIHFDKIFQLFQTLRPRDEVEGSGIGLSVVMKYVSNFGGKVTVASDGKFGSTFKVSWPKRSTMALDNVHK